MDSLLRWVGSKRWARKHIARIVRQHLEPDGTYYEPFLGGGSLFFALEPKRAVVSDILEPLMRSYQEITNDPQAVWRWSNAFSKNGLDPDIYNDLRDKFNDFLSGKSKPSDVGVYAGLFLYINHTCFNGLWRQNKNGKFNVPIGDIKTLRMPSQGALIHAAQLLDRANLLTINHQDEVFRVISRAGIGDVVFVDPPYLGTFNDYDAIFDIREDFHEQLACTLWQTNINGATIIAMNVDAPEIRKWYSPFCEIETINRTQIVSGGNKGREEWSQILAVAKP